MTDSAATDFETQLRDPETGARVVDPEQAGELVIRGPGVFGGYLGVDNRDVFTRDGWFRTGDLLAIDADVPSHYRIVGRIKGHPSTGVDSKSRRTRSMAY